MRRNLALISMAVLAVWLAAGCSSGGGGGDSLEEGLIARYPFDGNAADAGPSRLHGVVHGASGTEDRFGRADGALLFDGDDDCVEINHPRFTPDGSLSLSLWVKTQEFSFERPFVSSGDFVISTLQGDILWFFHTAFDNPRGAITAGAWNHFVGTYDGVTARVHVNGELVDARRLPPGDEVAVVGPLSLGCLGPFHWPGALDEVRIYDRPLTPAEVRILFER